MNNVARVLPGLTEYPLEVESMEIKAVDRKLKGEWRLERKLGPNLRGDICSGGRIYIVAEDKQIDLGVVTQINKSEGIAENEAVDLLAVFRLIDGEWLVTSICHGASKIVIK